MLNKCLVATSVITAIVLFPSFAHADDAFLSYGLGVFSSAKNHASETKILEVGKRTTIWEETYWNFQGGFWLDSAGNGRTGSMFASTGPGFEVDPGPFEIRNAYGLAFITSPDAYLGGVFPQFYGELYFGVRDRRGNGFGIKYNHLSSGPFFSPNVGRDFGQLELSIRW